MNLDITMKKSRMNYCNFINNKTLTIALGLGSILSAQAKTNEPNIIFYLVDDLGIGDLGCYGQEVLKTPAIDALAKNGLLFTNHYSGSTVSAPSRCVLLTGKHTGNAFIRGNYDKKAADGLSYTVDMPDSEVTIAEILKEKSYKTACFGKWGLGSPDGEGHPNEQGFDQFFGYLSQLNAHSYYPNHLFNNKEKVMLNKEVYSHDLIMDKVVSYIKDNAGSPFFIYMTPTLPHAELIVPEKDLAPFKGQFDEKPFKGGHYCKQDYPKATYAAMVKKMDDGIARIVDALKENGIYDNTIIVFSSDNGSHSEGGYKPEYFNSNGIYRGYKRDLYDGGIRTPMIIQWPEKIKAGRTTNVLSAFWDFLPTFADAANIKTNTPTDGISLLPTLLGKKKQKQHESLYFEFHEGGGKQAVIKDNWKLIRLNVNKKDQMSYELYDLKKDPSEVNNLASSETKKVKELMTIMDNTRSINPIYNFK